MQGRAHGRTVNFMLASESQQVTASPNANTIFMVWKFKEGLSQDALIEGFQNLCGLVINLNHTAANRYSPENASIGLGISHSAWLTLDLPKPLPQELVEFEEIRGHKHTAVSTPGDLHFHIRATQPSVAYDMASAITAALRDIAEVLDEVHGFRYWDGRSIIGFVDGTENPQTPAAREYFGIIGDSDPMYRGGSYQFVQKYIHDMTAWNALPVSEQEKVIGRSKQDDIEMGDDEKPANSHSAIANIGDDFKVIRDNMPFGTVGNNELGTYFICYASTFSTVQKMLKNMFMGVDGADYDRLLDFSTAVTGTLFFVPTVDMLGDFAG